VKNDQVQHFIHKAIGAPQKRKKRNLVCLKCDPPPKRAILRPKHSATSTSLATQHGQAQQKTAQKNRHNQLRSLQNTTL